MSEKYTPVKGDRVRVVLEGEVGLVTDGWVYLDGASVPIERAISVEKLEPPVVKFGPGDTVRNKTFGGLLYTLGDDGYFAHRDNEWCHGGQDYFDSRHYEKVNLVATPF